MVLALQSMRHAFSWELQAPDAASLVMTASTAIDAGQGQSSDPTITSAASGTSACSMWPQQALLFASVDSRASREHLLAYTIGPSGFR